MNASLPLRCPVTGAALHAASSEDLATINLLLESEPARVSDLNEVEGVIFSLPLTQAWINDTKTHAYLNQNGLPILVPDAAITL